MVLSFRAQAATARNGHQKEAGKHAEREETQSPDKNDTPRKGNVMNIFISSVLFVIFNIPLAIAIAYWQKGGYGNLRLALWWGIGWWGVLGTGLSIAFHYYVITPTKLVEEDATKPKFKAVRAGSIVGKIRDINAGQYW